MRNECKGYKSSAAFATAFLAFLLAGTGLSEGAGRRGIPSLDADASEISYHRPTPARFFIAASAEKNGAPAKLARTALREAESICKISKTLEQFGKSTLSQSVTILDMEDAALPPLLETAKDRSKDWRLRFWAVDLLGYVGNVRTSPALLSIVRDSGERRMVRLKALDSLMEIARRTDGKDKIKSALLKVARRVETEEIREKIRETVLSD